MPDLTIATHAAIPSSASTIPYRTPARCTTRITAKMASATASATHSMARL
jgi:hypothetical protein